MLRRFFLLGLTAVAACGMAGNLRQGRYAADMLGSDAFYWFALEASPSIGIYIMPREDIARFGLLTAPVIEF